MKKYIALLLALVMLLLAACGTAQPPVDEQTPSTEVTEPSGTEAVQGDPTEDTTQPSTDEPTAETTEEPTEGPTDEPTAEPTEAPTTEPTTEPTEGGSSGTDGTEATTPPTTPTEDTEPSEEPTNPPVEASVKLNKTSATLDVGGTVTLTATTTGSGTLTWKSSDSTVATVDSNGKVTAKKTGTTTISVSYGGKTATCTIKVNEVKLSVTPQTKTLDIGGTVTLTATYSGAVGSPAWSIESGSSYVSISKTSGGSTVVTAKAAGTAVINVTYGGKTAQCVITVNAPVAVSLSVSPQTKTLDIGGTVTLTATYSGATGSPAWSIESGSSYVSISKTSGGSTVVTAKAAGTAVIKATYGGKTAQCVITVNAPAAEETFTIHTAKDTELYVGDTLTLSYEYSGNKSALTVKSSNTLAFTVSNNNGTITVKGVGVGKATVAVYNGSTKLGQVRLSVVEKKEDSGLGPAVSISKFSNNGPWTSGMAGNSLSFNAYSETANGEAVEIVATSSNTGVATVYCTMSGAYAYIKVYFESAGSTTIKIASIDGNVSESWTITVGSYSSRDTSTPEAWASAVNYVVSQNGLSVSNGGNYTVLTLSAAQLTWGEARGQGEYIAHRCWQNGSRGGGCSYQGQDENGNYIFYLHTT